METQVSAIVAQGQKATFREPDLSGLGTIVGVICLWECRRLPNILGGSSEPALRVASMSGS
jgi:hypothetical protein